MISAWPLQTRSGGWPYPWPSSARWLRGDALMIGFLRRRQPQNLILRALYWIVLLSVVLGVLFVIFYFADDLLPGQGMF
jgi:hypothetical protein